MGGKIDCLAGWWLRMLASDASEINGCIKELEAKFKRPYATAQECYGRPDKICGDVVRPDESCTPEEGGRFGEWFGGDLNVTLAEQCARKLREMGYAAQTRIVPRFLISDAAVVEVPDKKGSKRKGVKY